MPLKILGLIISCLSLISLGSLKPDPLSLKINPRMGIAPIRVSVHVFLEDHEDNRMLHLDVYCDSMWVDGSSRDVSTYHPPYNFSFTLRERGTYTIVARLERANGKIVATSSQTVEAN